MFDHCDANTIAIVDAAFEEARTLGHNYLGTEHLLIALSRRRDLLPEAVAGSLPPADVLVGRLTEQVGAAPRYDAELLKTVGVDLEEVRSAVRQTFGRAAVERLGRGGVRQHWAPWRRPSRRCRSLLAGGMGMAPRAKQAFELARQDAGRTRSPTIDPVRLLLGMIDVDGAMSNQLLLDAGVDPGHLRRQLVGGGGSET